LTEHSFHSTTIVAVQREGATAGKRVSRQAVNGERRQRIPDDGEKVQVRCEGTDHRGRNRRLPEAARHRPTREESAHAVSEDVHRRPRPLRGRVQLVEHQVDDHPGDRDVEPGGKGGIAAARIVWEMRIVK